MFPSNMPHLKRSFIAVTAAFALGGGGGVRADDADSDKRLPVATIPTASGDGLPKSPSYVRAAAAAVLMQVCCWPGRLSFLSHVYPTFTSLLSL